MNDLAVKLKWNGGSRFTGVNAGGIETAIDADKQSGASPAELLLEALGACASADVVSILGGDANSGREVRSDPGGRPPSDGTALFDRRENAV